MVCSKVIKYLYKQINLSLCLSKLHAMKAYTGVEVWLHPFSTSLLGGGEWSASCPGRFTPGKDPFYPFDRLGGTQGKSGRGGG
jgi:hypothetical protein